MRRTTVLVIVLPLLALDLIAAGILIDSQPALVTAVIVGGLLLGILNTVFTESVMEATELPRSVASSAYSSVRFLGGAIAPPAAAMLAVAFLPSTPYFVGAASIAIAALVILAGTRFLARANGDAGPVLDPEAEAEAIGIGDAP